MSFSVMIDWSADIVVAVRVLTLARVGIIVASVAMVGSDCTAEAPNAAEVLGCAWASAILDSTTATAADANACGVAAGMTALEFASPQPSEATFLCC